jgi:hypothetical protein
MKKDMNKISKILAVLLLVSGTAFLGGCVKGDFDTPPVITPRAGFPATMTLAQFNKFYVDSLASGFGIIKSDIVIKGVVVGNDESGNIYKSIYIEDDSAGVNIALDRKTLYLNYKIGQMVFIKCKGLYLGNYGGTMELGYDNAGVIGRIPDPLIDGHLFIDSFPQNPPVPKLITIPTFSTAALCTLVKLDSVHFLSTDVGQPYSISTATTNRTLIDQVGNQVVLRTSSFATFAATPVPGGTGSIVGILSNFSGTWQLYIRDLNDVKGFGSK